VALINTVVGYGSVGRIVYDLSKMPGVEGKVYYGRKTNKTDADACKFTGFFENADQAVQTFLFDNHAWTNARDTKKLVADLEAFQPDLVHLHNLHGYYLDAPVLFSYLKESGVPVVWTLHDCWAFTGHCAHYEKAGCMQWKTKCEVCPLLNTYPYTWTGRNVSRNYERKKELFTSITDQVHLVVPSHWLKTQVEQSFLKSMNCTVIPTGIDLSVFHPVESDFRQKNHLEKNTIILAVSSGWPAEKGYGDLLKLCSILQGDEKLVVVGVNSRQKKELERLGAIAMRRTSNASELAALYSTSDVLINPTYGDTFPTVNLEALVCGCPVVTYRTGGSPEVLTPETGGVIDCGEIDEALELIRHSNWDRNACTKQGQRYGRANMLAAYEALYQKCDHERKKQ